MICSDAGPNYASAYGWQTQSISSLIDSNASICIIDNRIDPDEFQLLQGALSRSDSLFLLKFVDSDFRCLEQPYVEFIFSIKPQSNLFFLSPYHPVELGEELVQKHGSSHFINIPYAYDESREINIPLKNKKKRILLSGRIDPDGYPLRHRIHKETYRKLWSFFKVSYLKHSGYPDIGLPLMHNYINQKYIDLIAQHCFMLVTPSRINYELLKYSECAYGGSVPVGKKPSSFNHMPSNLFFEIDENDIHSSINKLFRIPYQDLKLMANGYRQWMRDNRNPKYLNTLLFLQLEKLFNG